MCDLFDHEIYASSKQMIKESFQWIYKRVNNLLITYSNSDKQEKEWKMGFYFEIRIVQNMSVGWSWQ